MIGQPPPSLAAQDGKALRCRRCGFGPLCLPAGVQPSEVALLDGVVDTRRTVEEGEALVRAGDPLRALYMLRSGSMKSEARCGGRVQVLGFHLPGEVAGWDGLATGRHRCDLVALERTSVCVIRYGRLLGLADRIPRLHRRLLGLLSEAAHRDWTVAVAGPGGDAETRVLAFLLNLAERLEAAGLAVDEVRLSMSREDIASYLGLAPETVSRAMVRAGQLRCLEVRRRRVRFRDVAGLRRALERSCANRF